MRQNEVFLIPRPRLLPLEYLGPPKGWSCTCREQGEKCQRWWKPCCRNASERTRIRQLGEINASFLFFFVVPA